LEKRYMYSWRVFSVLYLQLQRSHEFSG
jgi:hypothetical protein